jgi:subtilase family serine protease
MFDCKRPARSAFVNHFPGFRFAFCAAIAIVLAGARGQAATQTLAGHVPAANARAESLGRLGETNLDLAIGLPLRNQAQLKQFLDGLYDPASPGYRHFLTPDDFAAKFGPSPEDYQKVIDFARARGLTVKGTHANRVILDVTGKASAVEKAFHVNLHLYKHPNEARAYYAPDVEPSVDLDVPLLGVEGLNNFTLPRPLLIGKAASKEPVAARKRKGPPIQGAGGTPNAGSGFAGTFLGNDLRAAYVPGVSLDGTGQMIGLFEMDSYFPVDITAYETLAGLPAVTLSNVFVDGVDGTPSSNSNQVAEVSLDIEMAMSMTPGLSQVIVYEGTSPVDILNAMATGNAARQLSSSWSWSVTATIQQIFQEFAAQGQSFFEASGDNGAFTGTVIPPSDNPYITVVGGTTLSTSGPAGRWTGETAWNWRTTGAGTGATGGGTSTTVPIPLWQQGINFSNANGSATLRNLPDVAMLADDLWVIYNNGQSGSFGGTSASAPLWAGFMALVNQQNTLLGQPPVGFANPALYAIGKSSNYAACFHDIITGNNTNGTSGTNFRAVRGFDLCTGWGTPNGSNLINQLVQMPQFNVTLKNAGFESGTFSFWTLVGDTSIGGGLADGVVSARSFSGSAQYVHSGTYGAFLGESNKLATLTQNVATTPGQPYLLSFWFANPQGGTPNEFQVSWGGTVLFDQTNMGTFTWTNLQFVLPQATATNTPLVFAVRNDSAGFGLDDVGLEAVPLPSFQTAFPAIAGETNLIAFKWSGQTGLAYQLQYATDLNLGNWSNTGVIVTATNPIVSFSVPQPADPQGFFRLTLQP